MLVAVGFAYAQEISQKLVSIASDDEIETYVYTYDQYGRCIDIYSQVNGSDSYKCHDSIVYDANNNAISLSTWQFLNNAWKNVSNVEYTYDERHNCLTRTNYNFLYGSWNLGGIYRNTYDADNKLIKSTLEFAGIEEYQKIIFSYNDKGQITQENWEIYDFSSEDMYPAYLYLYSYDENDMLASVEEYDIVDGQGVFRSKEIYSYDANGNCTEKEKSMASGLVINRYVYKEFTDKLVSETLYPNSPEQIAPWKFSERPLNYNNTNTCKFEDFYALDDNGVLQHICEYEYNYAAAVSLEDIKVETLMLYPNPACDIINIDAEQGSKVFVYNTNGQVVMVSKINSNKTLDISMLSVGNYIVATVNGGEKHYGKLSIVR